jgi:hypothetical protein
MKGTSQKRKHLSENPPNDFGLIRASEGWWNAKQGGLVQGGLGRLGQTPEMIQLRI